MRLSLPPSQNIAADRILPSHVHDLFILLKRVSRVKHFNHSAGNLHLPAELARRF